MESLYEREITELTSSVKVKLLSFKDLVQNPTQHNMEAAHPGSAQFAELTQSISQDLNRLNLTVKQLEAEVRTSSNMTTRKALQGRVKEFKTEARTLQVDFDKSRRNAEKNSNGGSVGSAGRNREELFGGEDERVTGMNEKLRQGTEALEGSFKVMLDLEESAVDVSDQLKQNRETLISAHNKLKKSSTLAGQARSLLSRMENRQVRKKFIIYAAAAFVGFLMLFLVYNSLFG